MRRKPARGFSLIELMVTVAIIAIVASIAVISYLSAVTRARQKKTMNDMRAVASAWEARAADVQAYVVSGAGFSFPSSTVEGTTLRNALVPTYVRDFPIVDGWQHPYGFAVDESPAVKSYGIRSSGRDGIWQDSYVDGQTSSPDCDIVYANGSFIAYPAAVQEQ